MNYLDRKPVYVGLGISNLLIGVLNILKASHRHDGSEFAFGILWLVMGIIWLLREPYSTAGRLTALDLDEQRTTNGEPNRNHKN
jgi:hypothetical protein